MMTFRVCLKNTKKPTQSRLRFDPEKLRNSDVAGTVQAIISGKFAPLINLRDEDIIGSKFTTNNTAVTDKASEIPGRECHRKKALCWGWGVDGWTDRRTGPNKFALSTFSTSLKSSCAI